MATAPEKHLVLWFASLQTTGGAGGGKWKVWDDKLCAMVKLMLETAVFWFWSPMWLGRAWNES